eukprot:scaffold83918_cov63-Phaeocystis_antarctica.AAC.1
MALRRFSSLYPSSSNTFARCSRPHAARRVARLSGAAACFVSGRSVLAPGTDRGLLAALEPVNRRANCRRKQTDADRNANRKAIKLSRLCLRVFRAGARVLLTHCVETSSEQSALAWTARTTPVLSHVILFAPPSSLAWHVLRNSSVRVKHSPGEDLGPVPEQSPSFAKSRSVYEHSSPSSMTPGAGGGGGGEGDGGEGGGEVLQLTQQASLTSTPVLNASSQHCASARMCRVPAADEVVVVEARQQRAVLLTCQCRCRHNATATLKGPPADAGWRV